MLKIGFLATATARPLLYRTVDRRPGTLGTRAARSKSVGALDARGPRVLCGELEAVAAAEINIWR